MIRKFKFQTNQVLSFIALVALLSVAVDANAMEGTKLTEPVTTFLTKNVINNVGVVGVLAATILGAVAAFGQKISQFILNNLGYVAYIAFGATLSTGALKLAGMTI
ncbi:MAG: hypothetical protein ACR2HS_06045 [Gammaproteobacteria bacterium]